MAFSATPSTWLGAGYSLGTNQLIFNSADHATPCLSEVTNTEANATTGDIRKIYYGICHKLYASYNSTAVADRPARMTLNQTVSVDPSTGNEVRTFVFQFTTASTGTEVIAE